MNYKTLFQFSLVFLVLILSSIFYFKYFYSKNSKDSLEKKPITTEKSTKKFEGNTIEDILYESFDDNGNNYIIKSDIGTFSDDSKEEILMIKRQ